MKGYFNPRNLSKYHGDPTNIIYRSSWELRFMDYLDRHPDVVQWSSEEFCIPYRSPVDGRVHRYFVDFYIKVNDQRYLIEIKPAKFTQEPKIPKRRTKQFLQEVMNWGVNQAKWKAATEFCLDRKWKFLILTEKELGITNK